MWKMVWDHKISSLFQMEKQSGIQGIALTKPESVDDLATLNSVIRLMAQEKGAEQPVSKYARFKEDISLWYKEMEQYGLTQEEQQLLEPVVKISYGMCESQERFMELVQKPECGGFDLTWADKLRKSIAKKKPVEYEKLQKEYFEKVEEKGLSKKLCNYVWNVLVAMSRGYGFNLSHTLAYSLIALQEMNLAYKFPSIFWNCACLIADSGGSENEDNENVDDDISDEPPTEIFFDCVEEFSDEDEDEEDEEEDEEEIKVIKAEKKKKKVKANNYGKIASAIGKMKKDGVNVMTPDINKSTFTFSPDVDNNIVRYGLSGITRIGDDLIFDIIKNRPYNNLLDFISKIKITKPQLVNLIKSGAMDCFKERRELMMNYIDMIYDKKSRVTLQNMRMLIEFHLLPEEYSFQCKVYNFNKYLKSFKENGYYYINHRGWEFFEPNFDVDLVEPYNDEEFIFRIKQEKWEKIYQSNMDIIRPYVKSNNVELLNSINKTLYDKMWEKYAKGTISKWEMDSISFYYHEHELANISKDYLFDDFELLPDEPDIDYTITIDGKNIPIFKLARIAGTILDKDKNKKTLTLLTTTGVVTVKIFGAVFSHYDKQLSRKDEATGKKKVIEKSWFSRGNKVIITGIKRDDMFIAKKYARTPYHLVELITDIDENGYLTLKKERDEV